MSASSDNWITGRPSTSSSSGGRGRESKSSKNGDDMARVDLGTWKQIWSEDRSTIFASGTFKLNGATRNDGSESSKVGSSSGFARARVESDCECSPQLSQRNSHSDSAYQFYCIMNKGRQSIPESTYDLAKFCVHTWAYRMANVIVLSVVLYSGVMCPCVFK